MKNRQTQIYNFIAIPKILLGIALVFVSADINGQMNATSGKMIAPQFIEATFAQSEIFVEPGQIISNVLKIKNKSTDTLSLFLTLNIPPLWSSLFKPERLLRIAPTDSIFIPVRIIPGGSMKGNTKYFISASVEDRNRRAILSEFFFASTEKISSWELSVNPDSRIYFKNNETEVPLDVSLLNTGNEKQEIFMTLATANKNILVMDTADKPIRDFNYNISLEPGYDTTFKYRVKYVDDDRNYRNIDIENYLPSSLSDEKQFSLFFHSKEPRREKYSDITRGTKVDFIKLANDKKVNPYRSDVIPLSATLRVSNLLDDIVFSSLHLRGQKDFSNGGTLIYNSSLYFSSMENFYGESYSRNIPWYIGYFDSKKSLQAGYVNGGAIGIQSSGKGLKGEIEVIPDHKVGAFYVRSPYFFNETRLESFGLHHRYDSRLFSNLTQYSHSQHNFAKINTDVVSVSPRFKIGQKHNINFVGSLSTRSNYADPMNRFTRQGFLTGAGYSSSLFEGLWRLNLRGTYMSKFFGASGFERIGANHRSTLKIGSDLQMTVTNNYNQYNYDPEYFNYLPGYNRNYYFFNSINFFSQRYLRAARPGLFYDIRNHYGYNFHVRGLNISTNNYDITKNIQSSLITSVGLSRLVDEPDQKEHLTIKLNSMVRYQNLSFTGFYHYGPVSPAMIQMKTTNSAQPQTIRVSFIHMYLFPNRHLAVQSRLGYMYTNVYNHHSLNLSPEFFYFTNSGWRFSVNPTYSYYTSKLKVDHQNLPSYVTEQDYEIRRYSNEKFLIDLGIKKDFGIPIPTTGKKFLDVDFVAFYDLNGNKVQDENEPGIGNVVIRAGNSSVITNDNGESSLRNVKPENLAWSVLPLDDMKGWFPLTTDSLQIFKDGVVYIPFVKGVKVMGTVYVDKEIVNPLEEKRLDISGIKISAIDGQSYYTLTGPDGSFELFLPFGKYTISFDESIMNGRYYLLKNHYELDLSQEMDNMFITFHITERRRTVRLKKFGENGVEE